MIIVPDDHGEWNSMGEFLFHYAGVQRSADQIFIGWVSEGQLVIVVAFNGFVGSVAQIHFAFAPGWHFSPRQMLVEVFRYAFVTAKREMLLGLVNSKNAKALRMDTHLGFKELYRLPGMHDEGGDMVLLGMTKAECRYLEPQREKAEA